MSSRYNDIQWVIQRNLTNPVHLEELHNACLAVDVSWSDVEITPFSDELPAFDRGRHSLFYGSTTFIGLAGQAPELRKGVFFDAGAFSMENYLGRWGSQMLNYGASVTTFGQLMQRSYDPEKLLFIRPDDDSKAFPGEVVAFGEIKEWYRQLSSVENAGISLDNKIIVSEPFNIQYEWRLWIVEGKVVAASRYREYFKLKKERGCPEEVVRYAEERCREYTPHDVFVMDVCFCGDAYYIVECNCMNAAGFYAADITRIVEAVTDYFVRML